MLRSGSATTRQPPPHDLLEGNHGTRHTLYGVPRAYLVQILKSRRATTSTCATYTGQHVHYTYISSTSRLRRKYRLILVRQTRA